MSSMDTSMEEGDSFLSNTDAIIYGTSDHSGWGGDSMISDPNIVLSSTSTDDHYQQQITTAAGCGGDDSMIISSSGASSSCFMNNNKQSGYKQEVRIFNVDFRATSGVAVRDNSSNKEEKKASESSNRLKSCAGSELSLGLKIGGTVNYETSDRLVKTLMACAEAVQQKNLNLADGLVRDIRILAVQQSDAKKKVANYFAQALDRRIHETNPHDIVEFSYYTDQFYETSRYLKVGHFTTNQAIVKAFANYNRVHVIDFSLNKGLQWRALLHDLALRSGGPPAFRLTKIGPVQPDNSAALQEVEWKLAELADSIGVEFEYREIKVSSLAEVDATILDIRPSNLEAVAVNFVLELYHLTLSSPGAIEKLLHSIEEMQPKIVTSFREQAENHNGSVFVDRFNEAWHNYSTMFDFLEKKETAQPNSPNSNLVEEYLGRQIYNIVVGTELGLRC